MRVTTKAASDNLAKVFFMRRLRVLAQAAGNSSNSHHAV
jgi:hypothetical protein